MATSFAAFASQYLNKNPGASSLSSSQPMFFSFTTDGSRAGNPDDADIDDLDDPHIRSSKHTHADNVDEDDDPYLRLDDDNDDNGSYSAPLIQSQSPDSPRAGWLAHQASALRSPSPSPSSSSLDSASPPPPPQPVSLSLTESLLPRDGSSRPIDVFSLPDPRHFPPSRRKFNDSHWTVIYLALLTISLLSSILILFLTRKPNKSPSWLPYTTLIHTIPLLAILTFTSAAVAYAHIWLLRIFVKPVMVATTVFVPATLFISSIWAFIGSFMWDGNKEPTWGESWGLRIFSLVPLVLCLITARRLVNLPRQIHTTSSLLDLTTNLLLAHPFLLLLSPALLLSMLLLSIPFITLIFRLLLIGYLSGGEKQGWEWHVRGWANWAITASVCVWLWSWGVARGILRVTCAGVIGAWYFADQDLPPPPPTSTHTIHAAITRATSPSLGTIVVSALLLTLIRLLALATLGLRMLPYYLPPALRPVAIGASMLAAYGENVTGTLSGYALVYVGLTGDSFFKGARRARALVGNVDAQTAGGYKRRFKTEPPLTLLTIAPLTLSFPFALITYLFVAHTLGAPGSALGAAVLAGGVTSLVGVFCIGVLRDTADTLYVCYCIDKDVGERRRAHVFDAFEYNPRPRQPSRQAPASRPPTQHQHQRNHSYASPPPPRQQPLESIVPSALFSPGYASPLPPPLSPRRQVRIESPGPGPASPASPEEDVDPFERRDEEEEGASASAQLMHSHIMDEDSSDEEEQLFPGSDLF